MLSLEEDVEARALRDQGWSISAIAHHPGRSTVSRCRRPAAARKDYAPERKIARARDVRVGAVDVGLHKEEAHVVHLGEACVPIAVRGLSGSETGGC